MGEQIIYEDVLTQAGDRGPYQVATFIFMCGLAFINVETIFMIFSTYPMDHWCKIPELANYSFDLQKRLGIPYLSDSNTSFSRCERFNVNYSLYKPEELLNLPRPSDVDTVPCNEWVYDQSVYANSIVNAWDLVCDKSWQVDLVATVFLCATALGSIVAGSLSDRYGRVTAFALSIVIKIVSGLWAAFSPNYVNYIIARFFIGWGTISAYIVAFVLVMENVGTKHRPWMSIIFSMHFSFGYAAVSLFAFACQDRRNLEIVMAVPAAVLLFSVWFVVPESPRWLVSKGKLQKAEKGIRQIASVNGRTLPDDFDVAKIKVEDDQSMRKTSVLDLFKTPKIRFYTIVQCVIWFVINLIYYSLSLNAGSLVGDLYLNNALLGLVEIPGLIIAFVCMGNPFLGRRRTLYSAIIIGGIACLICVPLIAVYGETIAVTILSLIGKGGATAAYNGMFLLTSEIFPTEVRNVGLSMCNMVARFSGMAAPYMGNFLSDQWAPLPSLIFGVLGILCGFLIMLLPETYGKSLPETVFDLESGILSNKKASQTSSISNVAPEKADQKMVPSGVYGKQQETPGINGISGNIDRKSELKSLEKDEKIEFNRASDNTAFSERL